jgi:putative Mn2+ efflux pump MntP
MGLIEQTVIAFILSIDSFFVMAYVALSNHNLKIEKNFLLFSIILIAAVQTLFAFIGIAIGNKIIHMIESWDHWVVFAFFTYLAWKQWHFDPKLESPVKKIKYSNILLLAIMCSIDAFVVSLPLVDLLYGQGSYLFAVFVFTIILSMLGPMIFRRVKLIDWQKSSKIAALLIFILGTKILFEHLT